MFVTFKSAAYENITYFHSVAKELITLMGHSGTIPGAIKAAQLSEALQNLHHGLPHNPNNPSSDEQDEPEISLAKRAVPLIHMMEAAIQKNCDMLWSD